MSKTDELDLLLNRYKGWIAENVISSSSKIEDFSELLSKFEQFHDKYEDDARKYAMEFNIFDILWINSDEIRHSAFVRELLDPQGSHGQGLLFLEAFIKKCAEKDGNRTVFKEILSRIDQGKWVAWREHSTSFGRMDVVIVNQILGAVIVIENKIYAYEQTNQLTGYAKWLKEQESEFPYEALIFLTPSGYQSVSAGEHFYLPLSYSKDIRGWLKEVLPLIEAPVVKMTIQQYLDMVIRL